MPVRTFMTVIALFMCGIVTTAQTLLPTDTTRPTNTSQRKGLYDYNQTIYLSGFGPACGISLNYDIRFNGTYKGLGARMGFGYVPEYAEEYGEWGKHVAHKNVYKAKTTLPIGLNYVLAPSPKHMIEFGAGLAYMSGDSLWYDDVTTS